MIRHALAATALLAAAPLAAQSTTQEALDARYDRALAAGYKALFLCSAIANAEANGAQRSPESVEQWELSGIQEPLDGIVEELAVSFDRLGQALHWVAVDWSETMPPRYAQARPYEGCSLLPVGSDAPRGIVLRPGGTAVWRMEHEREKDIFVSASPKSILTDSEIAVPKSTYARAFDGKTYGVGARTTAVVIAQGGRILGEDYAGDFANNVPQRTWSVAKSIAATLVGASVQRGEADVSKSAGLGAGSGDLRARITINNLLRMASGRYSDTPGNRTDPLYFGGSTVEETALHWPLVHEPGTVYRYANNDTLAAVKAIGASLKDHPPAELFVQLGMYDTVAETDWRGDYILSSQVWSTARDLAKLGQLYLDDGVLPSGERILPEGWLEYVSAPSGPQPDGPLGYGAGFWLLNKSEGVPADTIAAMGNRGQYVVIVPSLDVVIVRRGEEPTGSRFDIAAFTRDVLKSLGK